MKKIKIHKWLRDRTSSIDFGVKFNGHPIHCNKNEYVLECFQHGFKHGLFLDRMNNKDFNRHFSNEATFYFTGNGRSKAPETLVMIDIDCHKTGTLAGAIAFAKYLRKHHFPKLYFEVSTNGNGVHGYIVLRKFDIGAELINNLLRRLQQHLRDILKEHSFDVEDVEIKGSCPVMVWGQEKGELTNYTSGQPAKFPREAHRFEELRNTTYLSIYDLWKLPPVRKSVSKMTIAPTGSSGTGSISGKVIGDEEIEQVSEHYREVADILMETHTLNTSTRVVATKKDVAIFLMLLRYFTNNMNADGSLPYKWFRKLWRALYESGDIDRQFDDSRFAVVRDYLSSLGLLDWQNRKYELGWFDDGGEYHKGKAAKWKASEMLMQMLDWESKVAATSSDPGENGVAVTNDGVERASFTLTTITKTIQTLVRAPKRDIIKPIMGDDSDNWMLNPDEIPDYITSYEEQLRAA